MWADENPGYTLLHTTGDRGGLGPCAERQERANVSLKLIHGATKAAFWRDAESSAGSVRRLFGPHVPFISPSLSCSTGPSAALRVVEEASLVPRTLLWPQQIYAPIACSTLPGKGRECEMGPGMEVEAVARILTSACASLRGDWKRENLLLS